MLQAPCYVPALNSSPYALNLPKSKGLELLLPASVFFATDGQTCIILLIIYLGLELLGEAF